MRYWVFIALLLQADSLLAANFEIIRVKDNRAIVKFDKLADLEAAAVGQRRKYSLAISSLVNRNMDSGTITEANFILSYGYNKGWFEYGPMLSIEKVTVTNAGVGFWGEWNFIANKIGHNWIPGLLLAAEYLQSSNVKYSYLQAGLFNKFFIFDHSESAVRLGISYGMAKPLSTSSGTESKDGSVSIGLQTYF